MSASTSVHEAPEVSRSSAFPDVFSLKGQHALVTGGGTGIGLAIAHCLSLAGARVTIAGRRLDVLERAASEIGHGCAVARLDIADVDGLEGFESDLSSSYGPVKILVNNAGNTVKKPFEDSTPADLNSVLDVHLRGALELSRHVIRRQLPNGGGTILFIASMTSFIGQPNVLPYTVAKTALTGAARGLSAEFASRGIRVNAVAPGWIDTDMFRQATERDPARRVKILSRIQTRALGDASDVGWACVYLASSAARYVTGHTLLVDGGGAIGF
jgi:NAD(P)-dependent dehydrogenase (short-subunit alcohol dehydrogenase family)